MTSYKSGEFEIHTPRGKPPYPRGGLALNIYLYETIRNSERCVRGLQAVQVVFTTLEHAWGKVTFKIGAKEYQGFIDRGPNSPWQLEGRDVEDKNRPYYLLYREMKAGGMDTAKAASPDRLFNFFDAPISLVDHEETYFETAMICRDYKGSGQDKVIAVYRWGWVDYGTRFKPRWDATATRLEVSVVPFVSDEFKSILQAEYATYAANFIPDAE